MALPILECPTYTCKLPTTNKEVKFRPFLVKEEKILLIAAMDEDNKDVILNAMEEMVDNCTFKQLDIKTLPAVDLEYLFLQIQRKSKGDTLDLQQKCQHTLEDGKVCGHTNNIVLDLSKCEFIKDKDFTTKVLLTDKVGVKFKTPSLRDKSEYEKAVLTGDSSEIFNSLINFVEYIFEGDTLHKDFTKDEFGMFIETLTAEQFKKFEDYFTKLPKLEIKLHTKCVKCGHEEDVTVSGIQDFLV